MDYDPLVLDVFSELSELNKMDIVQKLNEIAQTEYMLWLNNERLYTSRMRDLQIWRLSQFMEHIFNFKIPNEESVSFIFQITLSSSRSMINDYKAQYGRKDCNPTLGINMAEMIEKILKDNEGNQEETVIIPFSNNPQIDKLFEAVRRVAAKDSKVVEPSKVQGRPFVMEIEKESADKVAQELKKGW